MSNNVCTVIGTASDAGLQLAREYAADGFQIALVGMNHDHLDRYRAELDRMDAKVVMYHQNYIEGDHFSVMSEIFRQIRKENGPVKALVYNDSVYSDSFAGPGTGENPYHDIRLNCSSAMAAVNQVVPKMTKNRKGAIHFTGAEFNQSFDHGPVDRACQIARDMMHNLCFELDQQGLRVWETGHDGPQLVMQYFQSEWNHPGFRSNNEFYGNQPNWNSRSYQSNGMYSNWNNPGYNSGYNSGYNGPQYREGRYSNRYPTQNFYPNHNQAQGYSNQRPRYENHRNTNRWNGHYNHYNSRQHGFDNNYHHPINQFQNNQDWRSGSQYPYQDSRQNSQYQGYNRSYNTTNIPNNWSFGNPQYGNSTTGWNAAHFPNPNESHNAFQSYNPRLTWGHERFQPEFFSSQYGPYPHSGNTGAWQHNFAFGNGMHHNSFNGWNQQNRNWSASKRYFNERFNSFNRNNEESTSNSNASVNGQAEPGFAMAT